MHACKIVSWVSPLRPRKAYTCVLRVLLAPPPGFVSGAAGGLTRSTMGRRRRLLLLTTALLVAPAGAVYCDTGGVCHDEISLTTGPYTGIPHPQPFPRRATFNAGTDPIRTQFDTYNEACSVCQECKLNSCTSSICPHWAAGVCSGDFTPTGKCRWYEVLVDNGPELAVSQYEFCMENIQVGQSGSLQIDHDEWTWLEETECYDSAGVHKMCKRTVQVGGSGFFQCAAGSQPCSLYY